MADAEDLTLAALDAARTLVDVLHDDDIAERWWGRTLDLPEGVQVVIRTMGNNPERVRSLSVEGDFLVDTLRRAADAEKYIDQADVWSLTFGPVAGAASPRGASVDTCSPSGRTDRFIIAPEVRPAARASEPTPSAPAPFASASASLPRAEGTWGIPLIGDHVPVEPFDETGMLGDLIVGQLTVLRSGRHDVESLLMLRPIDNATAIFGAPPGFLPVLGLMTDGMTVGHMVDAEEVARLHHRLILYEPRLDGLVPTDDRFVLPSLLGRAINARWTSGDAPAAVLALVADLGVAWVDERSGFEFASQLERRRPLLAPTGWRWRNDSSGNGILAPKEAWGAASVRKPTSIDRAITTSLEVGRSSPAAALYLAHEALALANRANDVAGVRAAYEAMVVPLHGLTRPRVAARARALADACAGHGAGDPAKLG